MLWMALLVLSACVFLLRFSRTRRLLWSQNGQPRILGPSFWKVCLCRLPSNEYDVAVEVRGREETVAFWKSWREYHVVSSSRELAEALLKDRDSFVNDGRLVGALFPQYLIGFTGPRWARAHKVFTAALRRARSEEAELLRAVQFNLPLLFGTEPSLSEGELSERIAAINLRVFLRVAYGLEVEEGDRQILTQAYSELETWLCLSHSVCPWAPHHRRKARAAGVIQAFFRRLVLAAVASEKQNGWTNDKNNVKNVNNNSDEDNDNVHKQKRVVRRKRVLPQAIAESDLGGEPDANSCSDDSEDEERFPSDSSCSSGIGGSHSESSVNEGRSDRKGGSYLRVLLKALSVGELSQQEVVDNMAGFAFAAEDNRTLLSVLRVLGLYPSHQETLFRLLQDLQWSLEAPNAVSVLKRRAPLVAWTIKEVLRVSPTVPLFTRVAVRDAVVSGVVLPRGSVVHVDVQSLCVDEQFDPMRWAPPCTQLFIAFGSGHRKCMGEAYATLHLELTLAALVLQYQWTWVHDVFSASARNLST